VSVTTRQAILTVSRQLLEAVLPSGMVIECYADKVGALDYGTLERPLLLPTDARVTGVCVSGECFRRDQVLIRVACSAFHEVELSEILPERPPDGTCMQYQLPLPSKDEPKPVNFREFL
jgi:hypothetical protein